MTSLVMLAASALSMPLRKRGFPPGSPPPARAATEISRISLVKIFPRRASSAFLRASMEGPLPMRGSCQCWFRRWILTFYPRGCRATTDHLRDGRGSALEPAVAEERDRLAGRIGGEQQAAVRGVDDQVVGQAREAGFPDRNRAVVRAVQARDQRAQSARTVAG